MRGKVVFKLKYYLSALFLIICVLGLNIYADFSEVNLKGIFSPEIVYFPLKEKGNLVTLPDGTINLFSNTYILSSKDGGITWTKEPFKPTFDKSGYVFLDRDSELHLITGEGERKNYTRKLFHYNTIRNRSEWEGPHLVFTGAPATMKGFIQLTNGRLIISFPDQIRAKNITPPFGRNDCRVAYSDDNGHSWMLSSSKIVVPVYPMRRMNGAAEPSIIQLKDGRIWMLIRTRMGFLYESFSSDNGYTWSKAQPSKFYSSPANAIPFRLPDGRLMLFWNNCSLSEEVNGVRLYAERDQIHAAISEDEGMTWYGFREFYRDPHTFGQQEERGDRGTAYPMITYTNEGRVIVATGQQQVYNRSAIIAFDPDWLYETQQESNFANGISDWRVFKEYGEMNNKFRTRKMSVNMIDHPDNPGEKVMQIRHSNVNEMPDGAAWNFPIGEKGALTIRMQLLKGFQGSVITLNDRFFRPCQTSGEKWAVFVLPIESNGQLGNGPYMEFGSWQTIELIWDLSKGKCDVILNGHKALNLKENKEPSEAAIELRKNLLTANLKIPEMYVSPNGICYVRFRSTAKDLDENGFLIESVKVDLIEPGTNTQPLN